MRMPYLMMPLELHSDGGLGATAEAFEAAANALASNADTMQTSHIHLPINFLYRHAIELFLKSMILVLHRTLRVAYGTNPHDGPAFVPVDGNWKPIFRVHSVAVLWARVSQLIQAHASELRTRCRTDWQATPDGLDDAIASIETADASSTFFRYPDGRDTDAEKLKSSWKPKEPEDIAATLQQPNRAPAMLALFLHPDGETISEAFQYDEAPLADLARLLADTAKTLSAAHTGLRVELADGR